MRGYCVLSLLGLLLVACVTTTPGNPEVCGANASTPVLTKPGDDVPETLRKLASAPLRGEYPATNHVAACAAIFIKNIDKDGNADVAYAQGAIVSHGGTSHYPAVLLEARVNVMRPFVFRTSRLITISLAGAEKTARFTSDGGQERVAVLRQ